MLIKLSPEHYDFSDEEPEEYFPPVNKYVGREARI